MPHLTADALKTDPEGAAFLKEVCRQKKGTSLPLKVARLSLACTEREPAGEAQALLESDLSTDSRRHPVVARG